MLTESTSGFPDTVNQVGGRFRHWPWLAAILSGILLTLCFPRWDQAWLAWLALTPLIAAVWFGTKTQQDSGATSTDPTRWQRFRRFTRMPLARAFLLGMCSGLIFFWIVFYWLTNVTVVGWFLLAFPLAACIGIWAGFLKASQSVAGDFTRSGANLRLAFAGATAWTALEWARSLLGFGWNGLGVALHGNLVAGAGKDWRLPFMQITEYTGVSGLSFLLAFTNLIVVITAARFLAEAKNRRVRPHWDFNLTIALITAVFMFGIRTLWQPEQPGMPLRVATVQANIPQVQKFDRAFAQKIFDRYNSLTDFALAMSPQLLLWPEAATPGALFENNENFEFVDAVAKRTENFLLGTLDYDQDGHNYNIAALFTERGAALQTYRKIHLVPFGEFIPLRHSFPLFAWIVGEEVPSDFTPGNKYKLLQLSKPELKLASLICFEDTVGDLTRRFVKEGAQVLVNVTNDGWFKKSAGAEQHLAHAVFRAVENRRPLLRSANTGMTAFIAPTGKVIYSKAPFDEGFLFGEVSVPGADARQTFYTRHGEVFVKACALMSLAMAGLLFWRRR
ncbi:MAG: apolipoprotein N-acyltransferase [Verrucomicrobiota bacterium]